jgi:hypothetical protein
LVQVPLINHILTWHCQHLHIHNHNICLDSCLCIKILQYFLNNLHNWTANTFERTKIIFEAKRTRLIIRNCFKSEANTSNNTQNIFRSEANTRHREKIIFEAKRTHSLSEIFVRSRRDWEKKCRMGIRHRGICVEMICYLQIKFPAKC